MEKALEVANLHAWYGESHILHDLSFSVAKGGQHAIPPGEYEAMNNDMFPADSN